MFEFFYWPNGFWYSWPGEVPPDWVVEEQGDDWRKGKMAQGRELNEEAIDLWVHNKLQAIRAAEKRRKYGQT